jgi:hypothetical protein
MEPVRKHVTTGESVQSHEFISRNSVPVIAIIRTDLL